MRAARARALALGVARGRGAALDARAVAVVAGARARATATATATATTRARRALDAPRAFASSAATATATATATASTRASTLAPTWTTPRTARALLETARDLSKFRLSAFVVSTAAAGFVLGSPTSVDAGKLAATCAGTMLCSASANALNQVVERAPDGTMRRTACLLYTSPSPRDATLSRMPSSA